MRAERTQYEVAGWGVGELWTDERCVRAHDFRFDVSSAAAACAAVAARSPIALDATGRSSSLPKGGDHPPSGTVASNGAKGGDAFVTTFRAPDRAARLGPISAPLSAFVDPGDLVARVVAFLAGDAVSFDGVPLDLGDATPFQRAVAAALRRIPRGEVVTYAELAAIAGYPRAQRAVGTFCARNRFMFLLPCHRVVGSQGIGAYGSAGVSVKRRLLALDGVTL